MPDDIGLPPPPMPAPKPVAVERGPDLEPGFVDTDIKNTVAAADSNMGRLALAARGEGAGSPSYRPFTPNTSKDGLRPVTSTLENAVNSDSPEVAWTRFMGSAIMNPFTSGVDQYQAAKLRDLQQQFYANHGPMLRQLDQDLSAAKGAMLKFGNWLSGQHLPDHNIRGLMDQKAAAGKQAASDLADAIAAARDPDDQAKLQAMKSDFDKWQADRDERLKPEWKEEIDLENRIDKLNREIYSHQSGALQDAGQSAGPATETSDGHVISSTQQQPQSLDHAKSLLDFVLGERLAVVKAMKGLQ